MHRLKKSAVGTDDAGRVQLGEFLNFCPVIACRGTEMTGYDVDQMLGQLKKVYVERVVRGGFDNNYLYNNDLMMKLTGEELSEFKGLHAVIGSTPALPKSGDIDINQQGFTDEKYAEVETALKAKRRKEELTPE